MYTSQGVSPIEPNEALQGGTKCHLVIVTFAASNIGICSSLVLWQNYPCLRPFCQNFQDFLVFSSLFILAYSINLLREARTV